MEKNVSKPKENHRKMIGFSWDFELDLLSGNQTWLAGKAAINELHECFCLFVFFVG